MRRSIVFASLLWGATSAAWGQTELPTLNVYTYDSFASEWGPGPKVKAAFEAQCECRLNWVAVDGSTGILSRVQLEGTTSRADVVLGLDTSLLEEARQTGLLTPHGVDLDRLDLPVPWNDPLFLPFDYGYFAFIYDRERLTTAPTSFEQLAADDTLRIIIQDPRSSTPGLGLLLWIKAVYGDTAGQLWRRLANNIVTVTRSWSEAYGLFLDREADLVLSYTTSPAYHLTVAGEARYRAAAFTDGHAMQIEVAAQLATAPHPGLAQRFMTFIASDAFQAAIPTGNWMYPVTPLPGGLPPAFAQLVQPSRALTIAPERIARHKAKWVEEWRHALSR